MIGVRERDTNLPSASNVSMTVSSASGVRALTLKIVVSRDATFSLVDFSFRDLMW